MPRIHARELPPEALLGRYRGPDGYVDCYVTELPRPVSQAEYVEAFYTTGVFKLERWLLARFLKRASTDAQARELALGQRDDFAAWTVEARAPDQLLLRDLFGRTFGTAVVPVLDRRSGRRKLGFLYESLTPLHRLYSRVLLRAAARRLSEQARGF
jgi:hypothetical protein